MKKRSDIHQIVKSFVKRDQSAIHI